MRIPYRKVNPSTVFREAERIEQIYNQIPEEVIDEAAFGTQRHSLQPQMQPQMTLTKPSIMSHRDSVAQYSANRLNVQRPSYYSSKNSMYQSNSSIGHSEGEAGKKSTSPNQISFRIDLSQTRPVPGSTIPRPVSVPIQISSRLDKSQPRSVLGQSLAARL